MKLTPLLTDHAVVQRHQAIPVWGWTDQPRTRLFATLGGSRGDGISGDDGRFLLWLPALDAGGPHGLTVQSLDGGERIEVRDILVGEVWLASGQSNMQWSLADARYSAEISAAHADQIRTINVGRRADLAPQSTVTGQWELASPARVAAWSAVATFFGNRLQDELRIPVGIIHASWGGSFIQTWISRDRLVQHPATRNWVQQYEAHAFRPQRWTETLEDHLPADPGNLGLQRNWQRPDFDDTAWPTMPTPGYWQQQGHNYSAVMWYRQRITLPPALVGKDLTLHLGAVDKHDITYVNGVEVGRTGAGFDTNVYCHLRQYRVPAELTGGGELLIAVRAYSFLYSGGLTGPREVMRLTLRDQDTGPSTPLAMQWRTQVEHNFGVIDPNPQGMGHGVHNSPYMCYENMIRPLLPVGIAGAIWYQGESNAAQPDMYRRWLRDLVEDWRLRFAVGDFPFGVVQLTNFRIPTDYEPLSQWAPFRMAQASVLDLPNTGLVTTLDVGEEMNIHPSDKKTVGHRLAQWALGAVYGRGTIAGGPVYRDHRLEGRRLRVFFRHTGDRLATRDGQPVRTLYIAGADGRFEPAQSALEGVSLLAWHDEIAAPRALRYAWADNPLAANLVNAVGDPVGSFEIRDAGLP